MVLCAGCDQAFDEGRRRPKILPCGHSACMTCLEDQVRGREANVCPSCRKMCRVTPSKMLDNLSLLQNTSDSRLWCEDCHAEPRSPCFDGHVLCGVGHLRKRVAAMLTRLRPKRQALLDHLHGQLAEDLQREKQLLEKELDVVAAEREPAKLRDMLASAKALHDAAEGLLASADVVVLWESGRDTGGSRPESEGGCSLLRRALAQALSPVEAGRAASEVAAVLALAVREAAVEEKRDVLLQREATLRDSEQLLARREAAVREKEELLMRREAAIGAAESAPSGLGATVKAEVVPELECDGEHLGQRASAASKASGASTASKSSTASTSSAFEDWARAIAGPRPTALPIADQHDDCWMDALPDDVLAHVMSMLADSSSLLGLRLVCRRWERVALSPAVWRCQRLRWDALGVLRLAPALGELLLDLVVGAAEQTKFFRIISESRCKVRSLVVKVANSPTSIHLLVHLLGRFGDSLYKVNVTIVVGANGTNPYNILSLVSRLKNLRALELDVERPRHLTRNFDKSFDLESTSLERLVLGRGLDSSTVSRLLHASQHTLQQLKFGVGLLHGLEHLDKCRSLRKVTMPHGPGRIETVLQLNSVIELDVKLYGLVEAHRFVNALLAAQRSPKMLTVYIGGANVLPMLTAILDRISCLAILTSAIESYPESLQFLPLLSNVEQIVFDRKSSLGHCPKKTAGMKTRALNLASTWPASANPLLRRVHLHHETDPHGWQESLMNKLVESRPTLDICRSPDRCGDRIAQQFYRKRYFV